MLKTVKNFTLIFIAVLSSACSANANSDCDGDKSTMVYAESFLKGEVYEDFSLLNEKPKYFACYFTKQLKVIPTSRITLGEERNSERVIWAIRGLRLITGGLKQFSTTNYVFTKEELTRFSVLQKQKNSNEFLFFNELMSAPYIYVAPTDVQENIISSWHIWFEKNSSTHNYKLAQNDEEWYY